MNIYKSLFSAGLLTMGLASCTDLDVKVESQYTSYPTDEVAIEAKMADVYYHLRGTLGRRYMEAMALSSDEYTCLAFDGGYYDSGTYAHTALHCNTSEDPSTGWYSDVAAGITKANQVIASMGGDDAGASAASARAMRAYYTWILMDCYGDTPILKHVPDDDEEVVRSPRKEVAEWLESELLEIIPQLGTDVTANTYGKPTRWMAEALLAKIYINWGVYTASSVDQYDAATTKNEKLDDCIKICNDIISSGKFNLGSMEYRFKFGPTNSYKVEDFIYAMPYDAVTQAGMQYGRPRSFKQLKGIAGYYGGKTLTQSTGGNMVLTPEYADLFSLPGDQRNYCVLGDTVYNYSSTTLLPTDEKFMYKNEPVVFTKNITLAKTDNTVDVGNTRDSYCQGYHSIKFFVDADDYNNTTSGSRNQGNDLPIFRYADILLMKAEAMVRGGAGEATGVANCDNAMDLFNQIRSYAKAPVITATPSLEDIYEERGREFLDENWRRNDMIRFGHYEDQFFPHYTTFPDANFDKRHRIFPLPKEMTDLYPNWSQNDGY